jgi:hypothetical protein
VNIWIYRSNDSFLLRRFFKRSLPNASDGMFWRERWLFQAFDREPLASRGVMVDAIGRCEFRRRGGLAGLRLASRVPRNSL